MTYAETLSDKERRRARHYAYFACVSGCVAEMMINNSAIIILFFVMINGGDTLTMLGTSFAGISGAFFYIPAAYLITRIGLKKMVHIACTVGCAGFILVGISPWFGLAAAKYIALGGCLLWSMQQSFYGAAWYPLLDVFLRPEDRGRFFSNMRFIYTCFSGILFFIIGVIMKNDPPIIFLQIIIIVTGLLILGRDYCISRFPDNLRDKPEPTDIRRGLNIAMHNGPLTAYSVYLALLTLANTSLLPLVYLYLKQYVQMNSGMVQILSSLAVGGMIAGYFCYGRMLVKLPLKYLELLAHLIYTFAAFIMFFADKDMPGFTVIAAVVVMSVSFAYSVFMCNNSAELLALARPGNKTMATAFIHTYNNIGTAVGRGIVSLIIGTAMLTPVWDFCGRTVSNYQTLFLLQGLMLLIILILLPTLPSFVPEHEDYYELKK